MSQEYIAVLMDMLRSEVDQKEFEICSFLRLSEENQNNLVKMAAKHSVAHLVGDILGKHPETRLWGVSQQLVRETMLTVNNLF